MTKFQCPSSKQNPMSKISEGRMQRNGSDAFDVAVAWSLGLVTWDLFGAWCGRFGASAACLLPDFAV
jgi:hypothetical protein